MGEGAFWVTGTCRSRGLEVRGHGPPGEQPGEAGGTRSGRAEECGFYFVGDREPLSVFGPGRGELNRNQRTSFSGLS